MACYLRVTGRDFDVERFIQESALSPAKTWHKGERVHPASTKNLALNDQSGLSIEISDGDFCEFHRQQTDAIRFLNLHRAAISHLVRFAGVESAWLDFGIEQSDALVQVDSLQSELVHIAASFGLGIEISRYPVNNDVSDQK